VGLVDLPEAVAKAVEPLTRVPGVQHVVVAGAGGFPLYSNVADKELEEKVAAVAAVLAEVGSSALGDLEKRGLDIVNLVAADGSGALVTALGGGIYLAVVYSRDARLGTLLYTLRAVRRALLQRH
jgi:predicted regulator of Ras-like GTPase activity (Roadblock/LC7/MglB family)